MLHLLMSFCQAILYQWYHLLLNLCLEWSVIGFLGLEPLLMEVTVCLKKYLVIFRRYFMVIQEVAPELLQELLLRVGQRSYLPSNWLPQIQSPHIPSLSQ